MVPHHSKPLNELKIKAKRALKQERVSGSIETEARLKSRQAAFAKKAGFRDWQHAHQNLGGGWSDGLDAGSFWYSPKCTTLLNIWCRDLQEAEKQLTLHPECVLLPYKRQYILANSDFLTAIGLEAYLPSILEPDNRNLSKLYGNPYWETLALARLKEIFS